MDLDAFITVNGHTWARLDRLSRRRSLRADEIDEFVVAYERTATHLSVIRSTEPDTDLVAHLSVILSRARHRLVGTRTTTWSAIVRFFWEDFPAALWRCRWWTLWAAIFTIGVALAMALWFGFSQEVRDTVLSMEDQQKLVHHEFVDYYFKSDSASFSAQVWTNNAWLVAQCVVLGITGFMPLYFLFMNALNLGMVAGTMAAYGGLGTFFIYILPHGMLELTCVFVGAGAGFSLFMAWVRPGPLPRSWALASAARSLVTVSMGMVVVLFISGLVEGFVTPSSLPAAVRIGIGAVVWIAFLVYAYGRGRQVAARGITGDLDEEKVGDRVAISS
ncbi:stage II sporulation protein M [Devriesea agamarum]|uniref:stage II sporulation protein M n=1 Tax=Devriesea agamarum TaxID=472569 RepID=UPI00071DF5F0|nr:stage II sporulation protein M [Devriesea agamarum]